MMLIALELSSEEEAYTDMVAMYLDYFLSISYAVNFGLDGNGENKTRKNIILT